MKDCIALEIASALIDGGWVSSDRAEIKQYYELTDQEALEIVNAMVDLENDPYRQEDRLRNNYHRMRKGIERMKCYTIYGKQSRG